MYLVLAEGDVADGEVIKAGAARRLKARHGDVCLGVELLCYAPGDAVQLHAVELAVCHVFRQQAEEVADAHRRLKDAPALEAHAAHGLVDGADDRGRGVVRIERRASRGLVFVRREQRFQLCVFLRPVGFILVEHLGYAAPADVAGEFILLLGRGLKAVSLKVFEQLYGLDVRLALRLGPAFTEMLVRDAEVPRPPPRLLAELLQRRILRRRNARKALPLAVDRDVYYGLSLIGLNWFFGLDRFIGDVFGGALFEAIRNMPVPLVAQEQALEVCAALGAVDGIGHLRRQQLDVAALEVGYLELPPVEPHEVPDAVG